MKHISGKYTAYNYYEEKSISGNISINLEQVDALYNYGTDSYEMGLFNNFTTDILANANNFKDRLFDEFLEKMLTFMTLSAGDLALLLTSPDEKERKLATLVSLLRSQTNK